ncbi:MAG: SCP2 sterol-binding domain-containing protein [Deltaproteobacteria bacterium]|nr:SCP2 sterol-binding domain-containing protein [Deltaproteobacteria bacterium]
MAFSNAHDVFSRMPELFNAGAARGLDAVFQFDIHGEEGGEWHVTVRDDACSVSEGTHDSPRVTIAMSAENWLALVNRRLNGVQAFMTGKLKVSGDLMLAQRIYDIFPF